MKKHEHIDVSKDKNIDKESQFSFMSLWVDNKHAWQTRTPYNGCFWNDWH
jgi:hypothetical protein